MFIRETRFVDLEFVGAMEFVPLKAKVRSRTIVGSSKVMNSAAQFLERFATGWRDFCDQLLQRVYRLSRPCQLLAKIRHYVPRRFWPSVDREKLRCKRRDVAGSLGNATFERRREVSGSYFPEATGAPSCFTKPTTSKRGRSCRSSAKSTSRFK